MGSVAPWQVESSCSSDWAHVSCIGRQILNHLSTREVLSSCLDFLLPTRPWTYLVPQMIKNLPAMQKTQVQSLGWEDPLEKGMTAPSSILAWRIPWTEEPGGLQSMGSRRVRHHWAMTTYRHTPGPRMLTSSSASSRPQSKGLPFTLPSSFLLFSSQPSCSNGPQTEWLTHMWTFGAFRAVAHQADMPWNTE